MIYIMDVCFLVTQEKEKERENIPTNDKMAQKSSFVEIKNIAPKTQNPWHSPRVLIDKILTNQLTTHQKDVLTPPSAHDQAR